MDHLYTSKPILFLTFLLLLSFIATACSTKTFTVYTSSTIGNTNGNGTAQAPFNLVNESIAFSADQIKQFYDNNKLESNFIVNYEIDSSSIFNNVDIEVWPLYLLREVKFDCSISVNFNNWKRIVSSTSQAYFANQIKLQTIQQKIIANPFVVSLTITINELSVYHFYSKDIIISNLEDVKLLNDHLTINNCEFRNLFIEIETLLTININKIKLMKKAKKSCESYSWTISSNNKINSTIKEKYYNIIDDKLEMNINDVEFMETIGDDSCAINSFAIHCYHYNLSISNTNIRQRDIVIEGRENDFIKIHNSMLFGRISIYANSFIELIDSTLIDTITMLYPENLIHHAIRNIHIKNTNIIGNMAINEQIADKTTTFNSTILIEKCRFEVGSFSVQFTPNEIDHVVVTLKDLIFTNITLDNNDVDFTYVIDVDATELNIDDCKIVNNHLYNPNFISTSNHITNINNLYISNITYQESNALFRIDVDHSVSITNSLIELSQEHKNVIANSVTIPNNFILSNVTFPKSYCKLNYYSPNHFWTCRPCFSIFGEITPTNFEDKCTKCPAGTYANGKIQIKNISQCFKCPPGTYSKENETSNYCLTCIDQTYATGEGNIQCLQCSSDNAFISNQTPCKPCNILQSVIDSSSRSNSGAVCEYKPIVVASFILFPIILILLFCATVIFVISMRNKLNKLA